MVSKRHDSVTNTIVYDYDIGVVHGTGDTLSITGQLPEIGDKIGRAHV